MEANADLLASLILPSVWVFVSSYDDGEDGDRAALLTACALRRAGYKHLWAVEHPDQEDLRAMHSEAC
jgi:hypothetical protein